MSTPPTPAAPGTERIPAFNRSRLLAELQAGRALSRAELARRTGLARATVSAIVTGLLDAGVLTELREAGAAGQRAGRPGKLLAFAPAAGTVAGIDFGHSHVRVALGGLSGTVLAEETRALDVGASAAAALDAAAALVVRLLDEQQAKAGQVRAVVLGLPAPVDRRTGKVLVGNILPDWTDRTPGADLADRLGLPVRVENDANLGALGEASFGCARGLEDVLYLKVSSGIGAGLLLHGKLHRGELGIAGEIGHIPVDPDGSLCRCGNRGCLEALASAEAVRDLLQSAFPGTLTLAELNHLAADDPTVIRVLTDAGRVIGRVVAELAQSLNPAAIVIGGDLDRGNPLIARGVRESIDRYAHAAAAEAVTVMVSTLGPRAAVLGALASALSDPAFPAPTPRGPQGGGTRDARTLRKQALLATLRAHGPSSKNDLTLRTALPRATVAFLLAELAAEGQVVPAASSGPRHGAGRPAQLYRVTAPDALFLAASCMAVGSQVTLADAAGTVLASIDTDFGAGLSPRESVHATARASAALLREHRKSPAEVTAAALAVPAALDPATGALGRHALLTGWHDFTPADEFAAALGLRAHSARAENNANLAALAELSRGAGRGVGDFVYVHVHRGVGAAVIVGGELYRGTSGQAGEIGHLRVREFGPRCPCGGQGCLSPLTTARAVAAALKPLHGPISLQQLLTLGRQGDPATARVLCEAGRLIGRSLGSLCTVLDPAAVIVGGTLATAGPHLLDGLRTSLRRHVHPAVAQHLRVIPAQLREREVVLGAVDLLTAHQSS